MSKTPHGKRRAASAAAFVQASRKGHLGQKIAIARKVAIQLILLGGVAGDLHETLNEMVGEPLKGRDSGNVELWTSYCYHINAVYALGIAVGQFVHPDLFEAGGAR